MKFEPNAEGVEEVESYNGTIKVSSDYEYTTFIINFKNRKH